MSRAPPRKDVPRDLTLPASLSCRAVRNCVWPRGLPMSRLVRACLGLGLAGGAGAAVFSGEYSAEGDAQFAFLGKFSFERNWEIPGEGANDVSVTPQYHVEGQLGLPD